MTMMTKYHLEADAPHTDAGIGKGFLGGISYPAERLKAYTISKRTPSRTEPTNVADVFE